MALEARDRQGYIGDLSKKTRAELLDLLSRQEKLLANRSFINKLPDKGKKIVGFKQQIEQILNQRRGDVDAVAEELAKLRITRRPAIQGLDSDDDDEEMIDRNPNVWETLASNGLPTKIVSTAKSSSLSETLPALELDPDASTGDTTPKEGGFYKGLAQVMDEKIHGPLKGPLKLNRPRKPVGENINVNKPKRFQIEEESAVRYPIGPHAETKALPIQESLQLQANHMVQMKELQVKQAVERLAQKMNIAIGEYEPDADKGKMDYRDTPEINEDDDDDDACTEDDRDRTKLLFMKAGDEL